MTAEPSLIWKGTVDVTSEPFEFPFESPPGGCLLRYKFEVQDGYELAFMLRQGATSLLAKSGDGSQGEIEVAGEGMCSVRWENEGYISFTARQVSYEVAPRPLLPGPGRPLIATATADARRVRGSCCSRPSSTSSSPNGAGCSSWRARASWTR